MFVKLRLQSEGPRAGDAESPSGTTRWGSTWRRFFPRCMLVMLLAVGGGCGKGEFHIVRGRVEYSDGTPVPYGTVELYQPESKRSCRGTIARDGSFAIGEADRTKGAVAGTHQTIVLQTVVFQGVKGDHTGHERGIHPRFSRFDQSGLQVVVPEQGDVEGVVLVVEPARK